MQSSCRFWRFLPAACSEKQGTVPRPHDITRFPNISSAYSWIVLDVARCLVHKQTTFCLYWAPRICPFLALCVSQFVPVFVGGGRGRGKLLVYMLALCACRTLRSDWRALASIRSWNSSHNFWYFIATQKIYICLCSHVSSLYPIAQFPLSVTLGRAWVQGQLFSSLSFGLRSIEDDSLASRVLAVSSGSTDPF